MFFEMLWEFLILMQYSINFMRKMDLTKKLKGGINRPFLSLLFFYSAGGQSAQNIGPGPPLKYATP